jgi:hypothetical protein
MDGKGKKDLSFIKYKHRWRFDGISYWALPADAKTSTIIEYEVELVRNSTTARFTDPRNYPGTMHFQVRAMVYGRRDDFNPLREARTVGKETAGPDGLSEDVTRVTFIESRTFQGYCTGFFNVPYITGNDELVIRTKATERYLAITDKSYIYESAIQAGYDLKERSLSGLRNASKVIKRGLYLLPSNYIYTGRDNPKQVKFGSEGVQPGDILVVGKEQKLVVLYSDGGLEAKPDGFIDGTDVILTTGKNGLEKDYLANVIDDQFEVWRLIKKNK